MSATPSPPKQDAANPALPPGLSATEAAERLREDGPNELGVSQRRTLRDIVLEVLREPMFMLLLGAGGIYFAMGDRSEALMLLGFVFIIMGITVFQERRTDHALAALRDLSSPRALVLRDGAMVRIAGQAVVRGDVLLLAEGDRVPADGVLLQAHELATDESMLSGESEPVSKAIHDTVYAGTLVVSGQGVVKVERTGRHTEIGRIGKSLDEITLQPSPLREEMARLTTRLATAGIALSVAFILLFWQLRGGWLEATLAGISLAMSLLPQEFAVIMIVFLALAARRLGAHQVLTRRLSAIETLGQTTVLCVDKTGTLTENRMQVAVLCAGDVPLDVATMPANGLSGAHRELLEYLVLASEIEPHDPMEQAFHRLAGEHLAPAQRHHPGWQLAREYELTPALLAMTHLWHADEHDAAVVAAKGAPEAVASLCRLPASAVERVAAQSAALADRGLRVLGVARARHARDQAWPASQQDFDFTWLGLVALADPLRDEVPAALAQCRAAGIRVIMITGDHPRTATAIAAQAGIDGSAVVSGAELAQMDRITLAERVSRVQVFARVKPQQKLLLVEALKAQGQVVAMTGDGVNDAPALKAAHIGIAMGQRGTDVAREAASLVLLKDDLGSIVQAIRMGRRTFANMRQAMVYTLAVHIPIAAMALLPVLFGLPLMLMPLHIAFLELVIDPACSLVFEAEAGDEDLMQQAPRSKDAPLLSAALIGQSLAYGGATALAVFGLYAWLIAQSLPAAFAGSAAFVALVTANAALLLPLRSPHPEWHRLWRGITPTSLWVLAGTLAGLLAVTAIAPLAQAFRFAPLGAEAWLVSFASGLVLLAVYQALKLLSYKPRS